MARCLCTAKLTEPRTEQLPRHGVLTGQSVSLDRSIGQSLSLVERSHRRKTIIIISTNMVHRSTIVHPLLECALMNKKHRETVRRSMLQKCMVKGSHPAADV